MYFPTYSIFKCALKRLIIVVGSHNEDFAKSTTGLQRKLKEGTSDAFNRFVHNNRVYEFIPVVEPMTEEEFASNFW